MNVQALKENQRKPRPPSQKRRSPKKRQPDIRVKSVDMDTGGDDKLKRNRASTAVPLSSTFSSLKDVCVFICMCLLFVCLFMCGNVFVFMFMCMFIACQDLR